MREPKDMRKTYFQYLNTTPRKKVIRKHPCSLCHKLFVVNSKSQLLCPRCKSHAATSLISNLSNQQST